jgi:26S proteasome regulatory subunit N5|tara:strand:- start:11 stop:832 length:822 start_codon:yes stop_codon:yes gene_type:complete
MSETEKKEDKPAKQSTAAYLASLGLKGTTKKEKKRAKEDKDKKKDFTQDIESAFAAITSLSIEDAIHKHLLPLEKKTRLVQDSKSCAIVVLKIIELCYQAQDWTKLSDMATLISKRRSALQKVVYKMVVKTMDYLEAAPDLDTKTKLIETLRKVTEGKIFLELEEARLARMLSNIKESQGKIAEAANILQEITVETCGSMEAREKAEFMLDQVRLCLAKKDWVRSKIMSKKIKRSVLTEQGYHDLKLKHCQLAMEFHIYEDDMYELANDFLGK